MSNKKISRGSKNRTSTKSKRKNLYDWAWSQKGKGSLIRIGKKMKSLKRSGGNGSKTAIKQLGKIGDLKQAYNKGRNNCR